MNKKLTETAAVLGEGHPRKVLADNVRWLTESNECATQSLFVKRAKECGLTISGSSLSRTINATSAADVDLIAKLAVMFSVDPWRLLAPNLGGPSITNLSIMGKAIPPAISDADLERKAPGIRRIKAKSKK